MNFDNEVLPFNGSVSGCSLQSRLSKHPTSHYRQRQLRIVKDKRGDECREGECRGDGNIKLARYHEQANTNRHDRGYRDLLRQNGEIER